MASWNGAGEAPADFLAELYSEGEEEDLGLLEEVEVAEEVTEEQEAAEAQEATEAQNNDLGDDEFNLRSPSPPPYSPLTSPRRGSPRERSRSRSRGSPRERSRSRSPIWNDSIPSGLVIQIYDESGTPLVEEDDVFMTPDVHVLFESPERVETDDRMDESSSVAADRGVVGARGRNVRGRVRGGRSGGVRGRGLRARGVRGVRVGGGRRTWQVGHPLEEIWLTDDDVPSDLREMAREVVRRRQARMQANENENRSTRERRSRSVEEDESVSENEDENEATDGRGDSLLEGVLPHFEWSTMETFQSEEETFRPERTGSVNSYTTPYDAFRSFWDESILQVIVEETNRYAPKIPSPSFQAEWYPTNSDEILCLFGFWMMLGIVRMPTIISCFSTNPLLKTEIFRLLFSYKRYSNLVRALHFVNSDPSYNAAFSSTSGSASSDRLHLLRPIISHLNAKFQANYVMSKDICIDESLTLWKGRLNIKQYIRSKAAKFGIKTFELCESATGYLWSFLVYTGKHNSFELSQSSNDLKSTAVVKKLIAPLLHKGYRLFMDNWYNCPLLARFLKRNGTDCVGTLRASRLDVPYVVNKAPLKQGQFIARHSGDTCVLCWQDKKRITMISTCHGSAMGLATVPSRPPARPLPYKPQVVLDYNKSMGGVDLKDQMLEPYLLERKRCAKWYMKLFKRLLNCSILNARTLLQSSTQRPFDHLQFRLQLVDAILANHLSNCPKTRRATAASSSSLQHPSRFVNHTHWPVRVPATGSRSASNRQGRGKCVVCSSQNRPNVKVPFKCQTCDVPLCVENCFRIYHTP